MPIIGLLRVKNEARWIERVVRAVLPVCERVLILDDHSSDGTPEICERIPNVTVYRSESNVLNESADKDVLLSKAYEHVPFEFKCGNPRSPYFGLMIDGDEELSTDSYDLVRDLATRTEHAFYFRIPYLWNAADQIRVDGVYSRMAEVGRPSMFRLMNEGFRFQRTCFGNNANFHCSSVPQEMLHHGRQTAATLKHWGYIYAEDRIRKYHWYNQRDPNNEVEDRYRHMVIGDLFPADSKFKHAGPLQLRAIN
jgi:glycosyltransferase involved in cell wall biosynthesis